jgi:hypothetical protein
MSWIGVDLDGTLAYMGEGTFDGSVGEPIKPMVEFVKDLIARGRTVKIFTARVAPSSKHNGDGTTSVDEQISIIKDWCLKHIGQELEVTCIKDYGMSVLFDDKAVSVAFNTGAICWNPL